MTKISKREALARLFLAHRGQWLSAWTVAKAAGLLSHSQRVSDLRARGMQITNERRGTRSFYRLEA